MKIIKRLNHTDMEMGDAMIGWDIFRCGDYDAVDEARPGTMTLGIARSKIRMGHTLIFALNIGKIKMFKRLFITI